MKLFGEETRVMSIDEGCREEGLLRRAVSSSWGGRELDGERTVGHVANDGEVKEDLRSKSKEEGVRVRIPSRSFGHQKTHNQHETSTQPSTQNSHPTLPSVRPTIGRRSPHSVHIPTAPPDEPSRCRLVLPELEEDELHSSDGED